VTHVLETACSSRMLATSPTFALHIIHMPSLASLFSPISTTDTCSLPSYRVTGRMKKAYMLLYRLLYIYIYLLVLLLLFLHYLLFYYTELIQNITDIISVVFYLQRQLKYFQIMSLMFCILHHHHRTTRYNRTYYRTIHSVY